MTNFGEYANFIWNVADLLRGPYKPKEYGQVILPMTVLRRLDCVLEPTKDKVLKRAAQLKGQPEPLVDRLLKKETKQPFYNISKFSFQRFAAEDVCPALPASTGATRPRAFRPSAFRQGTKTL
jgi:type I restriction enzyme M protein